MEPPMEPPAEDEGTLGHDDRWPSVRTTTTRAAWPAARTRPAARRTPLGRFPTTLVGCSALMASRTGAGGPPAVVPSPGTRQRRAAGGAQGAPPGAACVHRVRRDCPAAD